MKENQIIKILRRNLLITKISFLLLYLLFFTALFLLFMASGNYKINPGTTINYSSLNFVEKSEAENIIGDLKDYYLEVPREIIFVENMSKVCENCDEKYSGINRHDVIYVKIFGNYEYDKDTVCHEIIHSLLRYKFSGNEIFPQEIAGLGVCYK